MGTLCNRINGYSFAGDDVLIKQTPGLSGDEVKFLIELAREFHFLSCVVEKVNSASDLS